jgi:hypothetical protein
MPFLELAGERKLALCLTADSLPYLRAPNTSPRPRNAIREEALWGLGATAR